jgi:hypothetical protein
MGVEELEEGRLQRNHPLGRIDRNFTGSFLVILRVCLARISRIVKQGEGVFQAEAVVLGVLLIVQLQ